MVFPPNRRKVIPINGELYIIYAEYSEDKVKDITLVKEWIGCTHAFRVNGTRSIIFGDIIESIDWESI